jgi:hypothetical protein
MSRRTVVAAIGVAAVAVGGALGGVFAVSGNSSISLSASSHGEHHQHGHMARSPREMQMRPGWSFSKLNNSNDPTFNQLLGINNRGQIAGYFGSGAKGHPNKGYVLNLSQPSSFVNENFPGGKQTQVIGINNTGVTVGFWSAQNKKSESNNNFGFYTLHGQFHSVQFPTGNNSKPPVNQLLGVNDSDIAVGFYTGAKGQAHAYAYSIPGGWFHRIRIPGAMSSTASGINNRGDIAGFYTGRGGVTHGFLLGAHGHLYRLSVPGASSTMAFGVNDNREVVGTYMVGSGNNAKSFGFIWARDFGFRTVNDPHGSGATTLNGINNKGDLVGFFTDRKGNTDGLLVAHGHFRAPLAPPLTATPMPTATPTATPTTTAPAPVPTGTGPTHF